MNSRRRSVRPGRVRPMLAAALACLATQEAPAEITTFFNTNQIATLVSTGTTSDTISCAGYQFTYTRDKLFTGGIGMTNPIGRAVRIPWPQGVEAQAVTAGPAPGGARITLNRVDGGVFDLTAFTFRLLANTAGAGATLEIMPMLDGEDALNDPLYFDATGYYGSQFSYNTATNYLGSTAVLTNYEAYKIGLYVDFALTALTLETTNPAVNHAPTDIALSNASVPENEPVGTTVAAFSTSDPDGSDSFTYTLIDGPGSGDNGLFSISGSDLLAASSFNYEVRTSCSIRVESTDQGSLATQKVFLIGVLDVEEPPPDFCGPCGPTNGILVLRWNSLANHRYAIHCSTNLLEGFTVLRSNIDATPVVNSYTDSLPQAPQKFWKLTTDP